MSSNKMLLYSFIEHIISVPVILPSAGNEISKDECSLFPYEAQNLQSSGNCTLFINE